mmetsp:Transcript_19361/g.35074  ORF Transcript_19361/g.35074 Transcript_19361/m.35074 type:complete len:484 (-) Transcript_19361:80-1531(-)
MVDKTGASCSTSSSCANWRPPKTSWAYDVPKEKDGKHRRMVIMMENASTFSDVEFRVGPEGKVFRGLKAMYARASEVFSKMFFEVNLRESLQGAAAVVYVSDIDPEWFEQLHRWVYDSDICLTPDNVFGVLEVARKYMLEDLELDAKRWISTTARTPEGVASLLAIAAVSFPSWFPALAARVESFGPIVLTSEAMHTVPFDTFVTLLNSANIHISSEVHVFEAAKAWADAAPKRGEDPVAAWKQIVEAQVVRFHQMELKDFAERVVIPQLLPRDDCLDVYLMVSLSTGQPRQVSLLGRLRGVLVGVAAEDSHDHIEKLVELGINQEGYPRALAQCLVERALLEHDNVCEWVGMWNELWGALRVAGLRDECIRATVDHCQNLFEDEPPQADSLVGVWVCPKDTLGLVRVLCKLNDFKKLAVLPLIKVLEVLVEKTEGGRVQICHPSAAAWELTGYLEEVHSRCGHLQALQSLPALRQRLITASR